MTFTYKELLSNKRYKTSSIERSFLADETESDKGRLIFSSPFRRLQQKAQVFPLEHNSAVRSRLTHTFEVAHLGRSIAKKVIFKMDEKQKELFELSTLDIQQAFIDTVESACLIHDIGNPPFGHFGEQAIRDWFKAKASKIFRQSVANQLSETFKEDSDSLCARFVNKYLPDFKEFDGNAQGFRIVTHLQWNRDEYGLNLTYSLLASYLKYLRCPNDEVLAKEHVYKKPGYFFCEKEIFDDIWTFFKLKKNQRHPLNYIMEAADDIAYCLSDIEDGFEKRILNETFFERMLIQEWHQITGEKIESDLIPRFIESAKSKSNFYFNFKIDLSRFLINLAAEEYLNNHDKIFDGAKSEGLLESKNEGFFALEALKSFARKYLYTHFDAENIELAGYATIMGLLDKYESILNLSYDDFNKVINGEFRTKSNAPTDLERRLFHRLPGKYYKSYKHFSDKLPKDTIDTYLTEWYYRAHLIVDYISGMTDYHAVETYQLLSGIKVES